jgi:hypothetical protein
MISLIWLPRIWASFWAWVVTALLAHPGKRSETAGPAPRHHHVLGQVDARQFGGNACIKHVEVEADSALCVCLSCLTRVNVLTGVVVVITIEV